MGSGGDAYEELLAQIPAALRATCSPVDPVAGELTIARCQPLELVGPNGHLTYRRYGTDDALFDFLGAKLDELGDIPTSDDPRSCAAGLTLTAYVPEGFSEGRLICAPDPLGSGGLVAWWVDLRFYDIGEILLFEGSYQELYDAVLAATLAS